MCFCYRDEEVKNIVQYSMFNKQCSIKIHMPDMVLAAIKKMLGRPVKI